jgi:Ca2+-binding EF-hand superfamily protein
MRKRGVTAVLILLFAPLLLAQEGKMPPAWPVLLEAHDSNGDGKIAASEYSRGARGFQRLDTNADGWITEADLSSPVLLQRTIDALVGDVTAWLSDQNKDGVVTAEEWRSTLAELDPDGDGVIPAEAFAKTGLKGDMLGGITAMLDRGQDGQVQRQEMEELFRELDENGDSSLKGDEIINWHPSLLEVGDQAPEFALPRLDDPAKLVRLGDFRGKRAVALIFGSYT